MDEPLVFCRNAEQFGDGSAVSIRANPEIVWYLDGELPWMSREQLKADIRGALAMWIAVCNVNEREAESVAEANVLIRISRIDGADGVLADAQLPSSQLLQQVLRIDVAESRHAGQLRVILAHEFGHIWGLQHFPFGPPPELMEGTLSDSVQSPQPTEAALMAKWYGPPKVRPLPPPAPLPEGAMTCTLMVQPGSDQVSCQVDVEQAGRKITLSGKKKW